MSTKNIKNKLQNITSIYCRIENLPYICKRNHKQKHDKMIQYRLTHTEKKELINYIKAFNNMIFLGLEMPKGNDGYALYRAYKFKCPKYLIKYIEKDYKVYDENGHYTIRESLNLR